MGTGEKALKPRQKTTIDDKMKKTAIQSSFLARRLELARWFDGSMQSNTGGPKSAFEVNGEIRGWDGRIEGRKLAPYGCRDSQ